VKALAIGILHRSVVLGDAIGNDILGSYQLFSRMGFAPEIVCEFPHEAIVGSHKVNVALEPRRIRDAYDMLIYHHSVDWPDGEKILNAYQGPVVAKYHCVTPPSFFAGYSRRYEEVCQRGREQTRRLAGSGKVGQWIADSAHNAHELAKVGVIATMTSVVPPFNRCDHLFRVRHEAVYGEKQSVDLLFVGRRSPNKGHRHLIRMLSSYVNLYSKQVRLLVVGAADQQLARYSEELLRLADEAGVGGNVEWLSHISDEEVDGLFRSSHVYVNASEHEGFCVPIVEAQAVGLPLLTVGTTACAETAGPNQIVISPPGSTEEYDVMAGLVHEIVTNRRLREDLVKAGFRNTYGRFAGEVIENAFVESLRPILARFK
jgi:glycosyltransferase involved in cell wall biosynthesis